LCVFCRSADMDFVDMQTALAYAQARWPKG